MYGRHYKLNKTAEKDPAAIVIAAAKAKQKREEHEKEQAAKAAQELTREKFEVAISARNCSSKLHPFLRRSLVTTSLIDVSSEADQYIQSVAFSNQHTKQNSNDWRRYLVLRVARPVEYVPFQGTVHMTVPRHEIVSSGMSLPDRMNRPQREWWNQFSRQVRLKVVRHRVSADNWISAKDTQLRAMQGYHFDDSRGGSNENGYNAHDEGCIDIVRQRILPDRYASQDGLLSQQELDSLETKTIPRYRGLRVHGGFFKGLRINLQCRDALRQWQICRRYKEPGGALTQHPDYIIHEQVRRPRLPLHGGIFKGITTFQGWCHPHRPKIYVPRAHAGVFIGQDRKPISVHGGLRRIKIPCRPRDLLPTVVTYTRYRHTIDAKVAKISKCQHSSLANSKTFGMSSPESRLARRREAELARQREMYGAPSARTNSGNHSRNRSTNHSRGSSRTSSRKNSSRRSRSMSRSPSRASSRPGSRSSSRSPSRRSRGLNRSGDRNKEAMGKLQYSMPVDEPLVISNLNSSDRFREAWFSAAKRGDNTAIQRLATMAENGTRLFRTTMHEEIGGIKGLINTRTKRGLTALHIAARHGHTSTGVILIRLGADLYSRSCTHSEDGNFVGDSHCQCKISLTPLEIAKNYDRDHLSFGRGKRKLKVAPVLEAVYSSRGASPAVCKC